MQPKFLWHRFIRLISIFSSYSVGSATAAPWASEPVGIILITAAGLVGSIPLSGWFKSVISN